MRYWAICALLAGCTSLRLVPMDYAKAPPTDWPKLVERVHVVSAGELPFYCRGLGVNANKVHSCAVTRFSQGACDVYLQEDFSSDPAYLEHERGHCRGYGHVGDAEAPAKAWQAYKLRKASTSATP